MVARLFWLIAFVTWEGARKSRDAAWKLTTFEGHTSQFSPNLRSGAPRFSGGSHRGFWSGIFSGVSGYEKLICLWKLEKLADELLP